MLVLSLLLFDNNILMADNANSLTVNVENAGTLSELVPDSQKYSVKRLTLTGTINSTDVGFLRDMIGNGTDGYSTNGEVSYLDISGCRIVAGGDPYYNDSWENVSYTTHDDEIGNQMFYCCTGLDTLILPRTATTIAPHAFHFATGLKDVKLPDELTSIGDSAFYYCMSLKKVTMPAKVTSFGNNIFCGCNALTSIDADPASNLLASEDGVLYNKDFTKLLLYPGSKEGTTFTFPETVTAIGASAFSGSSNLESLTIPDAVTDICDRAFQDCNSLKTVALPDFVDSLGNALFMNCWRLESANIPSNITSIPQSIFSGCESLKNAKLPDGVTTIGKYAFYGCRGITSADLSNVVTIDDYAFDGCTGMETVEFGENLGSIGQFAFQDCRPLTSITIPASVKEVKYAAFDGDNNITDVYSYPTVPPSADYTTFDYRIYNTATLHVIAEAVDAYSNDEVFKNFINIDSSLTPAAVMSINTNVNNKPVDFYNIGGSRYSKALKGINIIRMQDGSTKKVFLK